MPYFVFHSPCTIFAAEIKQLYTKMFKKLILLVLFVAPLSLCAQKFAQFDYNSIIQAMPEAKSAQTQLETIYKQYQTEIEGMQKELQTKAEKYQKEDTDATPANIRGATSRNPRICTSVCSKLSRTTARICRRSSPSSCSPSCRRC